MNLLFDQNLSYKLVNRLADVFPNASHVKDFSLSNEGDIKVWDFARKNDFTIVTQDSDFYDLALVNGTPPKIVWIRAGNSSTKKFFHKIYRRSDAYKCAEHSQFEFFS